MNADAASRTELPLKGEQEKMPERRTTVQDEPACEAVSHTANHTKRGQHHEHRGTCRTMVEDRSFF